MHYICGSESHDCVQQLYFLDCHRNVIAAYDPFQIGIAGASKEIELRGDGKEELVGVYGIMGKYDWLSSLGFLTKVRMGTE